MSETKQEVQVVNSSSNKDVASTEETCKNPVVHLGITSEKLWESQAIPLQFGGTFPIFYFFFLFLSFMSR